MNHSRNALVGYTLCVTDIYRPTVHISSREVIIIKKTDCEEFVKSDHKDTLFQMTAIYRNERAPLDIFHASHLQ